MDRAPVPLVGGILVGGASRRFGSPKAMAELDGVPFAERVAEALAECVDDLVVIGGGPLPEGLESLPRVADRSGLAGPLGGILGFFDAPGPERGLLVAACDQPLLDPAALRWLLELRTREAIAVLARLDAGAARLEPLPGLYAPACVPELERLAAAGGSLQPLSRAPGVRIAVPPAALRRAWTSVDTRAAAQALETELRQSH